MSFCSKCGNNIGDEPFCSKCGAPAAGNNVAVTNTQSTVSIYEQQKNTRIETTQELNKIFEYFNQKQAWYNRYDYLSETNEKLENELVDIKKGMSFTWFIYPIFLYLRHKKISNIKKIENANLEMEDLNQQLTKHYNDYGYCPMGIEYCHPKVLMELANIVRAGKADTIKEAINVLCEENHRSTMEFQAMVTAENSKKAASRAGVAAFNSGASAAFSAANFFFK